MKRLVIFGMFMAMMIARPANSFFEGGKKKIRDWIELPGKDKPVIDDINPKSGSFGTKVKIVGKNFDLAQMPITTFSPVYFDTGIGGVIGGAYAEIISRTDTEIVVEAPEGKGKVMVTVGSSNGVFFTYLPPVIEDVSPPSGDIGKNVFLSSEVTLTGKNFGLRKPTNPLVPCLLFGNSPVHDQDMLEWTDNKIIFRTPIDGGIGLNIPPGLSKIAAVTAVILGAAPAAIEIADKVDSATAAAIQLAVNRASKKGREVEIMARTLAGESNEVKFVYPPTEENLPTLPLPKWKEVPAEDGLATALVFDKSGSMAGEKIKRAKEAAFVYVDTCYEDEDMVSLTAFSVKAESITEPISIAEGREVLKRDILSLSSGGNTNVGSGLKEALIHLSSCNRKDRTALLLSDGRHNSGTYQPEVAEFQKKGWPISTVAFGPDADQKMLAEIAYQTGGSFFPADLFDIARVYHKINIQAHQGSVFCSYSDFLRPGKKLIYDIPVSPDMKKVGFFVNWQGSRMETTLISPGQTVINRSNISNFGRFVEGETHIFFELTNPQPGNWRAYLLGYDFPPQGEQVNFHAFCQSSDVFSNILGFQPRYSRNREVRIGVKLAEVIDGRLLSLKGAEVKAEVRKPSVRLQQLAIREVANISRQRTLQPKNLIGILDEASTLKREIILFDDGQHQDVLSGDGIYANTYQETPINGPYLVTVDFQGYTSQGELVKRTLQESFQVGAIEQNSLTISELLDIFTRGSVAAANQTSFPSQRPEKTKIEQTQQVQQTVDSLLNQFLKSRQR